MLMISLMVHKHNFDKNISNSLKSQLKPDDYQKSRQEHTPSLTTISLLPISQCQGWSSKQYENLHAHADSWLSLSLSPE